ncbi:hypothetical protein GY45DRAFT_1330952, partial [Cubamyces sp. BRFM 1775]
MITPTLWSLERHTPISRVHPRYATLALSSSYWYLKAIALVPFSHISTRRTLSARVLSVRILLCWTRVTSQPEVKGTPQRVPLRTSENSCSLASGCGIRRCGALPALVGSVLRGGIIIIERTTAPLPDSPWFVSLRERPSCGPEHSHVPSLSISWSLSLGTGEAKLYVCFSCAGITC